MCEVGADQRMDDVLRRARDRMAYSDVPIPAVSHSRFPKPPGPGHAQALLNFSIPTRIPWYLCELERNYPDIALVRVRGVTRYFINSPELIVETFLKHSHQLIKAASWDLLKPLIGNGLLTSEGSTHLAHRRLVQPAFHRERIATYSDVMVELSLAHQRSWAPGQQVSMLAEMGALALNIVGRTIFGTELSADVGDVGPALTNTLEISTRYAALGPSLWKFPNPARKKSIEALGTMERVINRIIAEHRVTGDTGDMLSLLMNARDEGEEFNDTQVRDEVMTMILAGHETTAMALTWAWMLLAQNASEAEWLREELDAVLAGRPPTMDDFERLPRTRAVIAESLRLYTPTWVYGRRILNDLELGGWQLPQGTHLAISPFALHRSQRWWPDAASFRPTRWIDASGAFSESEPGVPRGAWTPFGWGNRKCIGEPFAWLEASLVLATLAQDWAPRLATKSPVHPVSAVTLRPKGGLPMILERR